MLSLILLLFIIGTQLGTDERVIQNIDQIGGVALVLCMGSIIGSLLCVSLTASVVRRISNGALVVHNTSLGSDSQSTAGGSEWSTIVLVLLPVAVGISVSATGMLKPVISVLDGLFGYILSVLLFGAGIAVGGDTKVLDNTSEISWGVFAIPLLVAVGSIFGGVLSGVAIGFPIIESAAVSAGFGWYSYTGVVISKLSGVELGTIAFLANFLRELITFLLLPFVARYLGRTASIAPGGATTMDVTLPMIQRVSGDRFVLPALINGIILSLLASVLIPLILGDIVDTFAI